MKKIFLCFFTLFSFVLCAQTYVLEQSFGNNGVLQLGEYRRVSKGFLVDNTAYFLSGNGLMKIDEFGTTSIHDFNLSASNYNIVTNSFKLINNNIYFFGSLSYNSNNNFFIAKMDLDGNPDLNFGINGIKAIGFGLTGQNVTDLILTNDGNLLCTGISTLTSPNNRNLIVFKIDTVSGNLISGFDPNGYKVLLSSSGTTFVDEKGLIVEYNNEYLLVCFSGSNLNLIKIDLNGVVDLSYGINGYKQIVFGQLSSGSLKKISIKDNKLYGNFTHVPASMATAGNLFGIDLTTDQVLFNQTIYTSLGQVESFNLYDDGIYTCERSAYYNSTDKFYVSKKLFSGLPDTNFHINGTYSYDSPTLDPFYFQDTANDVLKLNNGDLLIAGYSIYKYASPNFPFEIVYEGGILIKITPGALGTNNYESNITSVDLFPNPFQNEINFKSTKPINKVEIYDLLGRKIVEPHFKNENNTVTVDLNKIIQKGTYLIRIVTKDNNTITKKIIKN